MLENTTPNPPSKSPLEIWKILGLNDSETKIMKTLTKSARSPAQISHQTGISSSTVVCTLAKLHKRNLVIKMNPVVGTSKRKVWKSNLPKIIRYLCSLFKII